MEWLTVLVLLLGSERARVCTHSLGTTTVATFGITSSIGSPLHLMKQFFKSYQTFFLCQGQGYEFGAWLVFYFIFVQAAEVEKIGKFG